MKKEELMIIGGGVVVAGIAGFAVWKYYKKSKDVDPQPQVDPKPDVHSSIGPRTNYTGIKVGQSSVGSYVNEKLKNRFNNRNAFSGASQQVDRRDLSHMQPAGRANMANPSGIDSSKLLPNRKNLAKGFDHSFIPKPRDFQDPQVQTLLNTTVTTRNKFNTSYDIRGDVPILPDAKTVKTGPFGGSNRSSQGPYSGTQRVVRSYVY